jgi:hypothetical protein
MHLDGFPELRSAPSHRIAKVWATQAEAAEQQPGNAFVSPALLCARRLSRIASVLLTGLGLDTWIAWFRRPGRVPVPY